MGTQDAAFLNFAKTLSDRLFDRFFAVAKRELTKKWPLLIAGGCGLNCEWNNRWRDSGLFSGVFVPPCANDSGSALGTALDAQLYYTGHAKVGWSVYAGEEFHLDVSFVDGFEERGLDYKEVVDFISGGRVIAWVQGRCEIGPRALCNRSILAAPFEVATRDRLNRIKNREAYRPVAPVCPEDDAPNYFEGPLPSPYMLYFQRVRDSSLRAVTYVDGTARVQTVNQAQNRPAYELLKSFGALTGVPVLCNTSLNFKGRGFINRLSDLIRFARRHDLDGMVVNDLLYVRTAPGHRL